MYVLNYVSKTPSRFVVLEIYYFAKYSHVINSIVNEINIHINEYKLWE